MSRPKNASIVEGRRDMQGIAGTGHWVILAEYRHSAVVWFHRPWKGDKGKSKIERESCHEVCLHAIL